MGKGVEEREEMRKIAFDICVVRCYLFFGRIMEEFISRGRRKVGDTPAKKR